MKLKFAKSGKDKRIFENDLGVSPVIAVILMVAITVVMAAIVSSWSSGVKAPTTPISVGIDVSRSGTNITLTVTSISPTNAAPLNSVNTTYTWANSSKYTKNMTSADVGNTLLIDTGEYGPGQLIVLVSYKDGSKKVVYSSQI